MNFPLYIAKRYLFTKTGNNAINIVTIIASFGVIVGALALFIILSGFSGLRTFSYGMLDVSDPDIKITPSKGKTFFYTEEIQQHLEENNSIKVFSKVIEERVFLSYNDKNEIAYIKGVENNYTSITNIDSALILGTWLDKELSNVAVVGNGISRKLSLGILNFGEPLSIIVPKPGVGFINPNNAFYKMNVQIVGLYAGTEDFENKFVFISTHDARSLLKFKESQFTGIELKLKDPSEANLFSERLQEQLGDTFKVQTKEQLNEVFYKVINTENFVSYLIFTLIVIISLFNVIGAIIMMIIDKKSNLKTLYSIGATVDEIKRIFIMQGFLLTVIGMLIGLFLGTILVYFQIHTGSFKITQNLPYPIEFKFSNFFTVMITITILGYLASKIASSSISKEFIER